MQPTIVSKGAKREASLFSVELRMSPSRVDIPRDLSEVGIELLEGRRRTVMEPRWGWDERASSTAAPNSPAPRTRTFSVRGSDAAIVSHCQGTFWRRRATARHAAGRWKLGRLWVVRPAVCGPQADQFNCYLYSAHECLECK